MPPAKYAQIQEIQVSKLSLLSGNQKAQPSVAWRMLYLSAASVTDAEKCCVKQHELSGGKVKSVCLLKARC